MRYGSLHEPARFLRPRPRPADALGICERLRGAGKRAWIVGGCVRDILLGKTISDWDVATDALPNEPTRDTSRRGRPLSGAR